MVNIIIYVYDLIMYVDIFVYALYNMYLIGIFISKYINNKFLI